MTADMTYVIYGISMETVSTHGALLFLAKLDLSMKQCFYSSNQAKPMGNKVIKLSKDGEIRGIFQGYPTSMYSNSHIGDILIDVTTNSCVKFVWVSRNGNKGTQWIPHSPDQLTAVQKSILLVLN